MTPQSVFDKVIDIKYYTKDTAYCGMCTAMYKAMCDGHITEEENDIAASAIVGYLDESEGSYLRNRLHEAGLPYDTDALMAIYKDWENRPVLPKKEPTE